MASFPEICKRPQLGTSMPRGPSTPTSVARAAAALPQFARDHGAELQNPAPHRFVRNIEPTLRQEILHIAVAQCEAEIEPNRVLDDRRRKAMTAIGERDHPTILARGLIRPVALP